MRRRHRARALKPRRGATGSRGKAETIVPETADAEFVSLEDAEAEQQGKKPAAADATAAAGEEEEVEIGDESLDDAAFIEEQEEGDADVTDIIGELIEKEEES